MLTYRDVADSVRGANKGMSSLTWRLRQAWRLWPLRTDEIARCQRLFVDWARLDDGRALRHAPLHGASGRKCCVRHVVGRCKLADDICMASHEPPVIEDRRIRRKDPVMEFSRGVFAAVSSFLGAGKSSVVRRCRPWRRHRAPCRRLRSVAAEASPPKRRCRSAACRPNPDPLPPSWCRHRGVAGRPAPPPPRSSHPSPPPQDYFWRHEALLRKLFDSLAHVRPIAQRADVQWTALERECTVTPTAVLDYDGYVEFMTKVVEVELELRDWRSHAPLLKATDALIKGVGLHHVEAHLENVDSQTTRMAAAIARISF